MLVYSNKNQLLEIIFLLIPKNFHLLKLFMEGFIPDVKVKLLATLQFRRGMQEITNSRSLVIVSESKESRN
jgi:hypothetical protein